MKRENKIKSTVNDLDKQGIHRLRSTVYKINQFVLGTLLSFFVLLNTQVIFALT